MIEDAEPKKPKVFKQTTRGQQAYVTDPETGVIVPKQVSQLGPTEKPMAAPEDFPAVRQEGALKGAESFGRAFANTSTLGAYAALTDSLRSPEEKELIKERDNFHPWAKIAGEVAPYLLPIGVGSLGAKAADIVFTAESEAVGKLMTTFAVDGMTQGWSSAANEQSLDGFTKDSLAAMFSESLFAGSLGAVTALPLAGLSRGAKTVLSRVKPGEKGNPSELSFKIPEEFTAQAAANEIVSTNRTFAADLYNEVSPLFRQAPKTAEEAADQKFYLGYFSKLTGEEVSDDFFTSGTAYAQPKFEKLKEYHEVKKLYGEEGRPVNKPLGELERNVNGVIRDVTDYRVKASEARAQFNPEALDTKKYVGNELPDMANSIALGETSFLRRSVQELETLTDPKITPAKELDKLGIRDSFLRELKTSFEGSAEKSKVSTPGFRSSKEIEENLLRELENHPVTVVGQTIPYRSLPEKLKPAVKAEFMRANMPKNVVGPEVSTMPGNLWKFLELTRTNIGKAWNNIKYTATKEESAMYGKYRDSIREEFAKLGEEAKSHAAVTDALADINDKLDNVKAALRQKSKNKRVSLEKGIRIPKSMSQDMIDPRAFNSLRSRNPSTGDPNVDNLVPALEIYRDTLKKNLGVIEQNTGVRSEELIASIDADINNALVKASHVRTLTDNSSIQWYKSQKDVSLAVDKLFHNPKISPLTRLIRGGEDLLSGNAGAAGIQVTRLAVEQALGLLSKVENPKTFNDFFRLQVRAMHEAKKFSDGNKSKISGFIKSMLTGLSSAGARGVSSLRAVPYSVITNTADGRKKVSALYKNTTDTLKTLQNDEQGALIGIMKRNQSLNYLSAGAGDEINSRMLGTLSLLTSEMPQELPKTQGGGMPSLIEQAEFLDLVTAVTQPYEILKYMKAGSVTPEMLQASRDMYPEIHAYITQMLTIELENKPTVSYKERSRIKSLFPMVDSIVMPAPGAVPMAPMAPPPQHPGDQAAPAMPKISGLKNWNAQQSVGTFTQTGGTGAA